MRRMIAALAAVTIAAGLVACRRDLPVRSIEAGTGPEAKIARPLRLSVLPVVRREDPLRLVVDLVEQPDWAAIGAEIGSGSPTRAERKKRLWLRLVALEERRASFLEWLRMQPGVAGIRSFRCVNRVAFDGSEAVVRALVERPDVRWIWGRLPDRQPVLAAESPRGEVGEGSTWAIDAIGARAAWNEGVRGEGVVVAVMDSGVTGRHPALAGRRATPVHDELAGKVDPGHGHGSAVLAAAVGEGIGIAPAARWTAVDPLAAGYLDPELLADSIDWLLETARPDVVIAPWDAADDGPPQLLAIPLAALRCAGMAVVFAAGNFGPAVGANHRPGNLAGLGPDDAAAFSVGGVSATWEPYQFSCRGPSAEDGSLFPAISAPAVALTIADEINGGTRVGHGTSYAAGYAGGALALVLSTDPTMTGPQAERLLLSTAHDLGDPGPDMVFGHGLIDVPAALRASGARSGSAKARDAGQRQSR